MWTWNCTPRCGGTLPDRQFDKQKTRTHRIQRRVLVDYSTISPSYSTLSPGAEISLRISSASSSVSEKKIMFLGKPVLSKPLAMGRTVWPVSYTHLEDLRFRIVMLPQPEVLRKAMLDLKDFLADHRRK